MELPRKEEEGKTKDELYVCGEDGHVGSLQYEEKTPGRGGYGKR